MRLFLVVFFSIFAIAQSQPPSPTPAKSNHAHQSKGIPEQNQAPANDQTTKQLTAAINQLTAEIAARNQQQPSDKGKHKAPPERWAKTSSVLVTIFTGALALLAIFQWCAMRRQAEYMRRGLRISIKSVRIAQRSARIAKQGVEVSGRAVVVAEKEVVLAEQSAKSSEKSAEASRSIAESHANTVKNAERPWLFIEIHVRNQAFPVGDVPSSLSFSFRFKNWGKTPAEVVGFERHPDVRISEDKLPALPSYRLEGEVLVHTRMVPAGEYWYDPASSSHHCGKHNDSGSVAGSA